MRDGSDARFIEAEETALQYATAYAAHYSAKDLRKALELYGVIVAAHPDSPEAGYSRDQMKNIARAVVPKDEILAAQVDLAWAYLQKGTPDDDRGKPGREARSPDAEDHHAR
jgi:hypothetical protein